MRVGISEKDKIPKKPYLPDMREQNPAPVPLEGQQAIRSLKDLNNNIMNAFVEVLPSNYVSEVAGPFYLSQFQAAAEYLAKMQLLSQDVSLESDVDFARPEFLWQMIGSLVFPDTRSTSPKGIPEISGDLTYRVFLKRMIQLLLQGSKLDTQQEGLSLLTDAVVTVLAKVDFSNDPNSAWGFGDQHEFEINIQDRALWTTEEGELIEGELGTGFPEDVFTLFRNNLRIIRALKPAKAIFEYRHLFQEVFGPLFTGLDSYELESWYYEDFRKFCLGYKEISGEGGVTLSSRFLFSDASRDFQKVIPGSTLEILTGPNSAPYNGGQDTYRRGMYRVVGLRRLPAGAETTQRKYTTFPSNLSGKITIGENGELTDLNQDFSLITSSDETLTILNGPNSGTYRIERLLGENGGLNNGSVPAGSGITSIRVAQSILELQFQMPFVATGQEYRITLERLGVQKPKYVFGEDASSQFLL
jgi:hypothetical protein